MTHVTPAQLDRIQELLKDRPQCKLVVGVQGTVTCDGMAIENDDGSVMHPLAFLDLCDGKPVIARWEEEDGI